MIDLTKRLIGVIAEKDTHLRFTSCNDIVVELAGLKSEDQLLGLTDYDCVWSEYADLYVAHEKDALSGKSYSAIIPSMDYTGRHAVSLHSKAPKKNSAGEIIGIHCRTVEIINPTLSELMVELKNSSPVATEMHYINKASTFQLPPRQTEVLFYLARGKSSKVIASILGISKRTVEYYIECIKTKLNCRNKAELISTAIFSGFIEALPQDNVKNILEKLQTE